MWLPLMKSRVGFRKIPSKKCASVEPVSEPDHCQIGMTVDQREGSLFRVQIRLETFALMTSSFSTLCNSLTCTSNPRPLRCHVPMPSTISSKCLEMLAAPWKVGIRLCFSAKHSPASTHPTLQPPLCLQPECRMHRLCLTSFHLSQGPFLLLQTNLAAEPCEKLHARDTTLGMHLWMGLWVALRHTGSLARPV